ncbi:unnamed protein product, partial [Hapterophycus canaliculatus]
MSNRPWTTGEIEGSDDSDDGSAAGTSADEFWREGRVLLRQTRSADDLSLSSATARLDPPSTRGEHSAEAAIVSTTSSSGCTGYGGGGVPGIHGEGLAKISPAESGAEGQLGANEVVDGDAADGEDGMDDEETGFPGELPRHALRRVSFADESMANNSAHGSLDDREQQGSRVQQTEGWGAQRRRMSSLIGSSNGYLEGNGSINGHFLEKDGRRKSDLERCRKAMDIARAAHELLFHDTRPDGLRPITGSPMTDGRDAQGSGGLFFGLAGLKGFDLSFVGALSTNQSGDEQTPSSVFSRLAASRRLSGRAAADPAANTSSEKPPVADGAPSSAFSTRAASPKRSNASRMVAGFLLDRKPGSLMASPPASPCCDPSPGATPAPPGTRSTANTVAFDEEGREMDEGREIVRDSGSPKTVRSGACSKSLKSTPVTDLLRCEASAARETPPTEKTNDIPAGGELWRSESLETGNIWQAPDIPEGFGQEGRKNEALRGLRSHANSGETLCEEYWRKGGSEPDVLVEMAASSSSATGIGSIFAPKAAVLWSARDLGVDELVSSFAREKERPRRPGSSEYVSRALLAAYKQATPVFEVEASSWSKREGAVAGVDYPLEPPAEWGWGGCDSERRKSGSITTAGARQGAWKMFERRPISRAEARALKELRMSQGLPGGTQTQETGTFGSLYSSENSAATSLESTGDNASRVSSTADKGSDISARSRDHFSSGRRRQRLPSDCDNGRFETSKPGRGKDERRRAPIPREDTAHDHERDVDNEPVQERTAQPRVLGPRVGLDCGDKHLPPGTAGRAYEAGESLPDRSTFPPPDTMAPTSGFGLGTALGAARDSVFRLGSEADADDVLRAMVRLSSAPTGTGVGEDGEETRDLPRHHPDGPTISSHEGGAHERPASISRRNSRAPAAAESRLLSSIERRNGVVCRGSTPAVRSGQRGSEPLPGRKVVSGPSELEDKKLDIEGRTLRSEEGPHRARGGFSRSRRTRAAPAGGALTSGTNKENTGRSVGPRQGRRRSDYGVAAARGYGHRGYGQKEKLLSESQSAPLTVAQQKREWSCASSVRSGNAGGDGLAGGTRSEDSLVQTLSSSALALNSAVSRSYAASLTSGASQQLRPLNSMDTSLGGSGEGLESNEPTTTGLRHGNSGRNQHSLEPAGTRAVDGSGSNKPSRRRKTQGESVGDGSTTRGGEARPANVLGEHLSSVTLGIGDDGDDGEDGDDKTTGEQMSVIIAGVTRDAAMSVFSSGRTGQPLSPIKSTAEIAAGSAASPSVGSQEPHAASNSAADTQSSTARPANGRESAAGKRSKAKSTKGGSSVGDESATKGGVSSTETGAAGAPRGQQSGLGCHGQESGGLADATPSSLDPSRRPLQNTSTAEKSKPCSPKMHEGCGIRKGYTTSETPVALKPAVITSSPGSCAWVEKEDEANNLSPAGLEKGSGNEPKSSRATKNLLPRTTNTSESNAAAPGRSSGGQATETRGELDKSRGDPGRSTRGMGASRSSKVGRTVEGDDGSPNSQGSSMSSRSSARSNIHVRHSRSTQKKHRLVGDGKSSSTSRGGVRTKETPSPGEANASFAETALLAVARSEATASASRDAQQDMHPRYTRLSEENRVGAVNKGSENVEGHQLPRISGAAVPSGGRSKTDGVAAGKSAQSAIKVHTRPTRVEDRDLQTTTEALTTHHLAVEELLKVGYDELLDGSDDEDDAADRRVRTRKEPLMIPQGSRRNGMAYWRGREEKERARQRRPRSTEDNLAAEANRESGERNGRDMHVGGAEAGGLLEEAKPQWEDEKEEIKRLLMVARARREAAVARVRAHREQANIDSETDSLGQTAAAANTSTPPASEEESRSLFPEVDNDPSPSGATALRAGPTADGKESTARLPGIAGAAVNAEGADAGRDRSGRAKGDSPPWKGFTLSDDGEAMLRRRRAPSPERVSPIEGREDWEYQLIVPGSKDNLVNFSVDTAAVRTSFGKLRRGVEIRYRVRAHTTGNRND